MWKNIRNLFSGSIRDREFLELRQSWSQTEELWEASEFNAQGIPSLVKNVVREAMDKASREPAQPILISACIMVEKLLRAEDIIALEALWPMIESDPAIAIEIRSLLARRRRWCAEFPLMYRIFASRVVTALVEIFDTFPESCFGEWKADDEFFSVPLIELVENPAAFVQQFSLLPYDDETLRFELFLKIRERLVTNLKIASGFQPEANLVDIQHRLIMPTLQKNKAPAELATLYLTGTPFLEFAQFMVPFHIPHEGRYEHCHIVGGTGHGKTQLMQRMIHNDLVVAKTERRSVVVIDSQGDLINKLMRLSLFDPDEKDTLAHRVIIIDPADVEFPFSLNLFDSHLERVQSYKAVDRERVLNGVIELYEIFFTSMLGAELTQKQGVIFRYLARLMITIPQANIHTLMSLMENGDVFKPFMDKLDGSARHFFQTEFFHPSFAATKKQILKRLWGVLSIPAFERMFAQPTNKLNLFEALNDGKIILISTAKDLLKNEGSALFGRFFIAMLAQAALERSTLPTQDRTPTFIYVDEAQEYFDDSIETILNQARKYRLGLTLAHQTLDQLSPRLRAAIFANTSLKCVGGVSSRDARALADELRTEPHFIESMRRYPDRTEFAVWLKHQTPSAIRLSTPLGFLERQPIQSEETFTQLMEANRDRYCCSLEDVESNPENEGVSPHSTDMYNTAPQPISSDAVDRFSEPTVNPVSPLESPIYDPLKSKKATVSRELGKGGTQHRYVQHLVKGLAEERGFRTVIEAPVVDGQIDVALYRSNIAIACEVSVTSTTAYEVKNILKCLASDFTHIFAIGNDTKRVRAIETTARQQLSESDLAKVTFLTPDGVAIALDALSTPQEPENIVRGYRVKVTRTPVSSEDGQDRRTSIARVIAQSLRNLPN